MYCRNCGAELPENAKFCPECGYKRPTESERVYKEEANEEPLNAEKGNHFDSYECFAREEEKKAKKKPFYKKGWFIALVAILLTVSFYGLRFRAAVRLFNWVRGQFPGIHIHWDSGKDPNSIDFDWKSGGWQQSGDRWDDDWDDDWDDWDDDRWENFDWEDIEDYLPENWQDAIPDVISDYLPEGWEEHFHGSPSESIYST